MPDTTNRPTLEQIERARDSRIIGPVHRCYHCGHALPNVNGRACIVCNLSKADRAHIFGAGQ